MTFELIRKITKTMTYLLSIKDINLYPFVNHITSIIELCSVYILQPIHLIEKKNYTALLIFRSRLESH